MVNRNKVEDYPLSCLNTKNGETTLYNIYKGKGKKEDLESMRFIHSKSYVPRTVEAVIVDGM